MRFFYVYKLVKTYTYNFTNLYVKSVSLINTNKLTARQIVDDHFSSNYDYYKRVCFRYYRGRYVYEDLLNEAYLKFVEVKDDVVIHFNEINKLHCIGLKVIRSLYQKRFAKANRKRQDQDPASSPLFETRSVDPKIFYLQECDTSTPYDGTDLKRIVAVIDDYSYYITDVDKAELEIQKDFEKATKAIEKALTHPVDNKRNNPYQMAQIFLAVQESSINKISKQIGVSRPYITSAYKEAQEYFKTEVTMIK